MADHKTAASNGAVRVAILQPTYWARAHVWNRVLNVDVFVWLDSVKFARSSSKWEDRTIVEGRDGNSIVMRLPLLGSKDALWSDVQVNDGWRKHETTIRHCYAGHPHWEVVQPLVEPVYGPDAKTIEEVCWRTFDAVATVLQPECRVVRSSTLGVTTAKGELILDLVQAVGGNEYLSGLPGVSYLPQDAFADAGVRIVAQDWQAPVTEHGLANPSIVHLLAEQGAAARDTVSGAPS